MDTIIGSRIHCTLTRGITMIRSLNIRKAKEHKRCHSNTESYSSKSDLLEEEYMYPEYPTKINILSLAGIADSLNFEFNCDELDILPDYYCSVSKQGRIFVKKERDSNQKVCSRSKFEPMFIRVQGTLIELKSLAQPTLIQKLRHNSNFVYEEPEIIRWSAQELKVMAAPEYSRCLVFRIILADGSSNLVKLTQLKEAQSWVDTLQSAANIAPDLDLRAIPQFNTLPRRRAAF